MTNLIWSLKLKLLFIKGTLEFDSFVILSDLSNLSHITCHHCTVTILKVFGERQDAMHKFLIDDRDRQRKTAEDGKKEFKQHHELKGRHEEKTQERNKAPKEKKVHKLFPKSVLFKEWGNNLSENDQREAEALFQKYGYNVFLSDRLPLDRPLPDTRDPRYILLYQLE